MKEDRDLLAFEHEYASQGIKLIGGIDEAGRGPLAGPVVAAIAIMDINDPIPGVDDSKKLSEKKREMLYEEIIKKAISYKIVAIDEKIIDEINILQATKRAMKTCIEEVPIKPEIILVDAVKLDSNIPCRGIIHGDALSYSIAAASILAKVYRDRLMREYDKLYPEYGFAGHKGYGTAAHIKAIKEVGPCPIHRRTFIKNFIEEK